MKMLLDSFSDQGYGSLASFPEQEGMDQTNVCGSVPAIDFVSSDDLHQDQSSYSCIGAGLEDQDLANPLSSISLDTLMIDNFPQPHENDPGLGFPLDQTQFEPLVNAQSPSQQHSAMSFGQAQQLGDGYTFGKNRSEPAAAGTRPSESFVCCECGKWFAKQCKLT